MTRSTIKKNCFDLLLQNISQTSKMTKSSISSNKCKPTANFIY